MCDEHRRQWHGWLDYRQPITGWIQFQENNAKRVEMSLEAHAAKVEERRTLIRDNITAIFELCAADTGCVNDEPQHNDNDYATTDAHINALVEQLRDNNRSQLGHAA
ncbi:hypothetical protein CH289_07910 [Rhodococcus sp. RS1C4]|nr:hypothetical protein CH289_07910 [Rhodococcus sp. RS1C4]